MKSVRAKNVCAFATLLGSFTLAAYDAGAALQRTHSIVAGSKDDMQFLCDSIVTEFEIQVLDKEGQSGR